MSLPFFPVIGALTGLIAFSLYTACQQLFPGESFLQAILLITLTTLITGGLHLDGLADVMDAFGGGKSREDIFRILKDSRLGTFGVLVLIFDIALKLCLYEYLLRRQLILILASQFIFSRTMMALTLLSNPYASGKTGVAAPFTNSQPLSWVGTILALLLFYNITALLCGHLLLVIPVLVASLPCLIFIRLCRKKISGITGDCLGAINEIYEISFLFITLLTSFIPGLSLLVCY